MKFFLKKENEDKDIEILGLQLGVTTIFTTINITTTCFKKNL